jgi:glutaminyl-peptide cyclotransferase
MMAWLIAAVGATLVAVFLQAGRGLEPQVAVPVYGYEVVNVYPHDPDAFTQGLLFRDGVLYESTGLYGESTLRRVRLDTGEVLQERRLERRYFGEGLVDWNNRLIQLTWQENTAFVYDIETFAVIGRHSYRGEGWGLTHDGERLIMSDGSSELRFLAPDTFAETGRLRVTEDGRPVHYLNELAMVRGEIFANVWGSDHIFIIDPQTGAVTARVDLSDLLSPAERVPPVDVLNGIAYDAGGDRLFVTGKRWPKLFEIRLERQP